MTAVWGFLSRTQGGPGRLSKLDIAVYAYLVFGFLLILVPTIWLALNSFKSQAQLERQDISLLPTEFTRVARATVNGPDGREILIVDGLPEWVIDWASLSEAEQATHDIDAFIADYDGATFYSLRSHLGLVAPQARAVIEDGGMNPALFRYPSMSNAARAEIDLDTELASLDAEEIRLVSEFLGIDPYAPNRLIGQIELTAPDPETGETRRWAASSFDPSRDVVAARAIGGDGSVVRLPTETASASRSLAPAWSNYSAPLTGQAFGVNVDFARCFTNSVLVTILATALTLLINSMAAFALSKYSFRGQGFFFVAILATLLVPPTITLVGVFKAIDATGLSGTIWGVIIPGAATPAGVFLLRQYMLTIPDELMEAARMDAASEWKIYWKIILPLALPALAALGILSIVWRWNDLILPMVAIATAKDAYTIQLCLLEFRGEHLSQEHYRLAMTVVSLIPTTLVFVFLQKFITTGIASQGGK